MNILLDSHALLWSLHDPGRLAATARRAIADPANAVFFSVASVWELELKAAQGKLILPANWVAVARETGFVELPIASEEAAASTRFPWHHADPFDRLLLAQAQAKGFLLATCDATLGSYGVPLLAV